MKISRVGNQFFDENGKEIKWQDIAEQTGMDRSQARLTLKHLARSDRDVPPESLNEWRETGALIWALERC